MTTFQSLSSGSLRSQGSSGSGGDVAEEMLVECTTSICEKATTYGLNKCFKMNEKDAENFSSYLSTPASVATKAGIAYATGREGSILNDTIESSVATAVSKHLENKKYYGLEEGLGISSDKLAFATGIAISTASQVIQGNPLVPALVTATAGQFAQLAAATAIGKVIPTFGSKDEDDQSQSMPLLEDDNNISSGFASKVKKRGHSHSLSLADDRLMAQAEEGLRPGGRG